MKESIVENDLLTLSFFNGYIYIKDRGNINS